MKEPVDYWVQAGEDLRVRGANRAWRAYCDGLNAGWLRRALPERSYRRALKTDLYDEAVGGGLEVGVADWVMGIDVAASTARLARERRGLAALAADVRELPFGDGTFDLVVSFSTLDHFQAAGEISRALREIRRVMAAGGVLALTLDNLSNPIVRLRNRMPWPLLVRTGLVPYYVGASLSYGQLRRVLTESGFRMLDSTAIMHGPRVLMVPLAGRGVGRWLKPVFDGFERLEKLPTRNWTGLYLAVVAEAS